MCKFLTWHAITRIFQIKRKTSLFGDAKQIVGKTPTFNQNTSNDYYGWRVKGRRKINL